VARAASLCQRRHRPPYDAVANPQTGSPGGGAYARRYHDREHVNESGQAGCRSVWYRPRHKPTSRSASARGWRCLSRLRMLNRVMFGNGESGGRQGTLA
jgi:hypothetical protein